MYRLARYSVHTTATWDRFWNITQNVLNYQDGVFLVYPLLIESRSYKKSSPKLVKTSISPQNKARFEKFGLSQKSRKSENLSFFSKVPAFQNTLTLAQYLFNSRSNMHVNLVHWNSLHSKKAILPTFFRKNSSFSQ